MRLAMEPALLAPCRPEAPMHARELHSGALGRADATEPPSDGPDIKLTESTRARGLPRNDIPTYPRGPATDSRQLVSTMGRTTGTTRVQVFPSVLAADFGRLAAEVEAVERVGANGIHLDVMDGQFVPNITAGPVLVRAARKATGLFLDVHLMIVEPERYVKTFADAGADSITIHAETSPHCARTLQQIRDLGKQAGIALTPQTSHEAIRYLLPFVDWILVMSVNPGFGGQRFMPEMLPKVRAIRELIDGSGAPVELEIDGGIQPGTARLAVAAGARTLVAGAAIYGQPDYRAAIATLRDDASAGLSVAG